MKQPKINDNPIVPDAVSPKPSDTHDNVREDGLNHEGFIGNPAGPGAPGVDVLYQPTNYLLYD